MQDASPVSPRLRLTAALLLWVACAALLIASNHVWHVLGGMCMTDGLLVAFYTAALYALFSDPWLESRGALGSSRA